MNNICHEKFFKKWACISVLVLFALTTFAMDAPCEEATGPTFTIYAYPNTPWTYHEEMGTVHQPLWAGGAIMNGAFNSFGVQEALNNYGTVGEAIGSYPDAEVKILLFGSSFTTQEATNLLQEKLAKKLGKSVHVLNFSVGSNG